MTCEEDQRAAETLGASRRPYARRSNQWPLLNQESGDAQRWAPCGHACIISMPAIGRPRRSGQAARVPGQGLGHAILRHRGPDRVLSDARFPCRLPREDSRTDREATVRIAGTNRRPWLEYRRGPACNEFAWLAANTEGDLDEALRLSKRSLDLAGEHGSYCDTLARVYFAKGDYANAVKHQSRAAELLPVQPCRAEATRAVSQEGRRERRAEKQ